MRLIRFCYSPQGTFGILWDEDSPVCYTVENPWKDNQTNISCIPEGIYKVKKRVSPIVQRTSNFEWGWHITNVPDRTYIMIHPGNTQEDVEGCIAVGEELSGWGGKWAVTNSQDTFAHLMKHGLPSGSWELEITFDKYACK